ncbi:hypothetical protein INR49_010747 [Caranx melampygus]|nr:hypothetical protein INR49_010747 [Caranx melampygus]
MTPDKVASAPPPTESELAMQLECSQTEVEFVRRRLKQTEEKLETERQTRQQLDAKVREDTETFDSELTQALEEADSEREQKDKAFQENTALGAEIYKLRRDLQESRSEVERLQKQKEELCAQIRDLSLPVDLTSESLPDLKKQLRLLETQSSERNEEISRLTARIQQQQQIHMRFEMEMERMKQIHQKELEDKEEELEDVHKSSQRRLRQLEMQLEQEYEEKQMVIHEKHDLEGLIATLCDQVGHRDFDVEKKLRRDLKRTHALLADAQLLLSTVDSPGLNLPNGSKDQIERLHCQHEKVDLLKRLEEDQEDLNELMKKHKALIAQSSSDITQIKELQAELEEVKKQRHSLQEEVISPAGSKRSSRRVGTCETVVDFRLQQSVSRVQFLESSTVGRSIVSKQEARVCDLENKLEFQRGQVKRFEVLVLRLRDSVVRLGEELEQSAQAEARERENARYYLQRLQDMKLEMEELIQREGESSRRRMELVTNLQTVIITQHVKLVRR